ncbi:unnamed protein product [Brassicogethes aeneus]|uniref:Uncharacterized protein n=1 Tax=Brassicogethes aeneus TaxID=1431903 RepID=A0A9P0AWK4_BRAAE|nr:unnamed protein product [Brassicogethes aeneus]
MFSIGISNTPLQFFTELLNEIEIQQKLSVTPMHFAAAKGSLDLVNTLLLKGFDIDSEIKHDRFTPLYLAIAGNHLEMVKFLIAHGADVNYKAIEGITPLSFATMKGSLDMVNILIANGADLSTKTDDLHTLLHLAAEIGHLDKVNFFIKKGLDINAPNNEGERPLYCAVKSGNLKVIKALISHGSDVNASGINNTRVNGINSSMSDFDTNITSLHLATFKGRLDIVEALLEAGANVNAKTGDKFTPLHVASQKGFLKLVDILLKAKSNVNAKNNEGFTPLQLALQQGYFEVSDFLIKNGANINSIDDQSCTSLHFVAYNGNLEVAKYLLAKGADINAKTIESYTPLHIAVDYGHLELVEWLLKKGADVNALDDTNGTPLHIAAEHGFDEITTVLLKHGADVTVKDTQSQCTALNLAAHYGHFKVVKTLKNAKNIQSDGNLFHGLEFAQNCLPSKSTMVRIQKAEATISKPEAKEEPEPELPENKRLAMEEKEQGNAFYKKKEFDNAIARYRKAIEHDPTDITFYNNLAAVHFEQKEFEKCVKECEKGIEVGRENRADFKLIAKSFIRIGNAYKRMKKYESAKTCYEKSLTEHRTPEAESLLSDVENVIKEEEIKAYFDMELAEKEKEKGNELFKKGDFAAALRHYCEAIKRNPDDAKLYSNRAACYTKLGLEDCDKCVELDPKFLKGFIRKGHILQGMQQQEKAIFAFLKALEIDPNNAEALHGLRACFIENSNLEGDQNSEKIWQRAKHDPEVQAILKLPAMRRILEQMQNDGLCQIS